LSDVFESLFAVLEATLHSVVVKVHLALLYYKYISIHTHTHTHTHTYTYTYRVFQEE